MQLFEKVNDPYVYERIFAVAYGCALRTKQKEYLADLSEYVFKTIFQDKKEVYPHVLLRDYARNIIEFTNHLGYSLSFKIEVVRPPYTSSFTQSLPSDDEITTRYELDYKSEKFKEYHWGQNSILSSMGDGDFGRYTFKNALRAWDINSKQLSNLAIEWIFEKYGYDVEKHGGFDRQIGSGRGRETIPNERIGKKYQWIALYEMVARVSDSFPKYDEWSYRNEKVQSYQGPWSPYIRDIDPSMIIPKIGNYEEDNPSHYWWSNTETFNWECSNEEWIKTSTDLPNITSLIEVKDQNDEEWLILEGYPQWAEPKKIGEEKWDYPHKRLWYQVRSYLVDVKDFEKLRNWAGKQDFMGRWMPESSDRYEIFSREYYWSPAYRYFMSEYYGGTEWSEIHSKKSEKLIAPVIISTESFLWEEEFDKSKDETISFLKPCLHIYTGMNLIYSRREGEFLNDKDELVCFAANVYHNSKSVLLIKKEPFLQYLENNGLKIVWTVLGEKQIIGGRTFGTKNIGRLEISGAYYINKNKIEGEINISTWEG